MHQDRHEVVRLMTYWKRRDDLDAEDVERLGGKQRDDDTAIAWRGEWPALPRPIVPTMVRPDGALRGLGALHRVRTLIEDRES